MEPKKIFDYLHYKNLGTDYKLWSEENLSQFLIWDLFNSYSNLIMGRDFLDSYVADVESFIKGPKPRQVISEKSIKRLLDLLIFLKSNGKKKKIIFQNSNYSSIVREAKKNFLVGFINPGKRDRLLLKEDFFGRIDSRELEKYFLNYLSKGGIKYLHELVGGIERRLESIKPDYIVLSSDISPVERAIVLASRKLGITTIEIQHGLYFLPQNSLDEGMAPEPLVNGKAADYVLLWGNYFKDLYERKGVRNREDLYVLGYPYLFSSSNLPSSKNGRRTLCYLGQDFERFNRDFLNIKLETVRKLAQLCKKNGFHFLYRPHPWGEGREAISKNMPEVEFTPKGENIRETFKKADIFLGFSSTGLVEAAIQGKISLQLINYPIQSNNFEKLGVCHKSFKTVEELENYLIKIKNTPDLSEFKINFNNDFIETRYDPGQRFSEIIKEIKNKLN